MTVATQRDRNRNTKSTDKRWDFAVDRVLNSGLMHEFMPDFWRYVDGEITWEQFNERMSP